MTGQEVTPKCWYHLTAKGRKEIIPKHACFLIAELSLGSRAVLSCHIYFTSLVLKTKEYIYS